MKALIAMFLLCLCLYGLEVEKPNVYKNQAIKGWLMSEKLDGIRAVWNGKNLLTKNGNTIHAPKTFTKNFPPFYLDGELWTKRDDFETIQSIVLDKKPSKQWSKITYNIFEVPYAKGNFNTRLEQAKRWFKQYNHSAVRFIQQIECKNKKHLESYLEQLLALKAEGIIIKNPNLNYINKRHSNSLKVKKFSDMEGLVIAINYKNNTMKSLRIQLKNGIVFNLGGGFSKKERLNPPKINDTVTFKYYGLSKYGKPKFASFLRIRQTE